MAAASTVWPFNLWAQAPFIAKAFLGRRYERCALAYCRRRRWKVIARNVIFRGGEIDLLCRSASGLVIVEVRGRGSGDFLPRHTLSPAKIRRLQRYASGLRTNVRIVLLEIVGALPSGLIARWWLAYRPEWFGIRMRELRIA